MKPLSLRLAQAARYVTPRQSGHTACLYGVNAYKQIAAAGTQAGVLCAQLGAQVMRISAPWVSMQFASIDAINYTILDAYLNGCAANNIVPIIVMDTSPPWANGGLSQNGVPTYLGPNWASWVSAYTTFAVAVAQHAYAICPTVIMQPMNEPNTNSGNNGFWRENDTNLLPTFAAWNAYHAAIYSGIKAANSSITVITAAMKSVRHWFVEGTDGTHGLGWIQSFMSAGGVSDGIAIHPYPAYAGQDPFVNYGVNANSFTDIGLVRAAMIAGGNDTNGKAYATYPVHVTEFGNYNEHVIGSPQKAIWTGASYRYVDQFHSIDAVGASAAPVVSLCYFNLVNNFNGTVDTDFVGMFDGNPYAGPNTLLSAGAAFQAFMTGRSPVTSVSLFYNSAPATPMLLFTGNTYTMVAKDQSGNVLSGVGTWTTTDATNAPVNSSTGVISPATGITGATITYTHTASGHTATVVVSVLKQPTWLKSESVTYANDAALRNAILSSVTTGVNTPAPTGTAGCLYQDGINEGHVSLDATRLYAGRQTLLMTFPLGGGDNGTGGVPQLAAPLPSSYLRLWGLAVKRYDSGFTTAGGGGGAASYKDGPFAYNSGLSGRTGVLYSNTNGIYGESDLVVSGSTVGGNPAVEVNVGTVTTEWTDQAWYCDVWVYEGLSNLMSERIWRFKVGTNPNSANLVSNSPVVGPMNVGYTPMAQNYFSPFGQNYNQQLTSNLFKSIGFWGAIDGVTYGDPLGLLQDATTPSLSGITGGTIAHGTNGATVTLTGTNLSVNCYPTFSNAGVLVQSISVSGGTTMTIVVNVTSGASIGAGTVSVTNYSSQNTSGTQTVTIT